MFKKLFLSTLLIFNTAFAQQGATQNTIDNVEQPKLDKSLEKPAIKIENNQPQPVSASSIKKSIEDLFSSKKIKSLMFSDTDYSNIDRAIESFQNNQVFELESEEEKSFGDEKVAGEDDKKSEQDNVKSYIYLSSVLYFGENSWSLWINDKKYTSKNNIPDSEMYFKKVSKDKVNIIWKLSISKWKILSGLRSESLAPKINSNNQVEIDFVLQPNQTFILSSNKVVAGRAKK
jgi:hypothetical protein